jgi:hypothetical protein
MSDAIDSFAATLDAEAKPPLVVYPDWGLAFQVVMLSGARVPASFTLWPELRRDILCAKRRDIVLAVIEGDRAARITRWASEQGLAGKPEIVPWRQRDRVVVFEAARFRAADQGAVCAATGP